MKTLQTSSTDCWTILKVQKQMIFLTLMCIKSTKKMAAKTAVLPKKSKLSTIICDTIHMYETANKKKLHHCITKSNSSGAKIDCKSIFCNEKMQKRGSNQSLTPSLAFSPSKTRLDIKQTI